MATRRKVLKAVTASAGALAAGAWIEGIWGQVPQPMASPNAPNQNVPAGLDGSDILRRGQPAPPNTMNHLQIAGLVQELFKLATELKDEVEHTNLRATLPVDFVKRAQQIEKLAKQIKDRAKG